MSKKILDQINKAKQKLERAERDKAVAEGLLSKLEEDINNEFGVPPEELGEYIQQKEEERENLQIELEQQWVSFQKLYPDYV